MKQIIDNINVHKHKSAGPLLSQQVAYIPSIDPDQIECSVQSYLIDGKRTIVNQSNQLCLKLRYLKFKVMEPRKDIKYKNGIWTISHLVSNNVLHPFMVFINGVFIPWEYVKVATGQENYYIIIDVKNDEPFKLVTKDPKYAQIINLPNNVRYERFAMEMDDTILFSFNRNGEFSSTDRNYVIRKLDNNTNMMHHWWSSTIGVNAFPIFNDTSIKLTSENIILFTDGKLTTGIISKLKRAHDDNYKNEEKGYISPCLEFTEDDEDIQPNPNIEFDSTLLTIGNGTNESGKTLNFAVFVNSKYTSTVDNISHASLDGLSDIVKNKNAGNDPPSYYNDLKIPFEMGMDRKKKYDENVANAIKTMLSYNASLFNPVFKEISNLDIEEYTGKWINSNTDSSGTLTIPRQHSSMIDEYILMLVNGVLYKYYYMGRYVANKYIIPIQGINNSDTVELLRFQNVNNLVSDITIKEDDNYKDYDSEIINDNMILYSTETDANVFEYPSNGLQHFPVEYELDTNDDGQIKITLNNSFYYGKPLKVAYKNRYKHFWFNLTETTDKYTVDLQDKFMYCNDYSKYLVFYNGRRLGSDHFRLTLPVRPTTPFYKFDIYLTLPIKEGDRLDVIYVPSLMQDIVMIPEVPVSGDMVIDKNVINHGLSTDLYMVWVNGKKIPSSHVFDIDSTHMRIITDEESTKTVCITKYIPDIDIITNVFKNNEALWDSIIARLTNDEISKLLGINGDSLSNTETNIYAGAVNIRAIMYELIREQFIMNPRVDITGPFVYDYQDVDTSVIEGYDSQENAILSVADANKQDNLDHVERPWP